MEPEYITRITGQLVRISQTLPSNPEKSREGGYVLVGENGLERMSVLPIGSMRGLDEIKKYGLFVKEKAHRLYADWCRRHVRGIDAVSSWQTRNESNDQYGGAVLMFPKRNAELTQLEGGPNIISFSGCREDVDEAISLTLGYQFGWADDDLAAKVVAISNNKVFPEMLQAYRNAVQ